VLRCGPPTFRSAGRELYETNDLSVTHRRGGTEHLSLPPELLDVGQNGIAVSQSWWDIFEQVSTVNEAILRLRELVGEPGARIAGRRRRR
jgi:hypothetical protein